MSDKKDVLAVRADIPSAPSVPLDELRIYMLKAAFPCGYRKVKSLEGVDTSKAPPWIGPGGGAWLDTVDYDEGVISMAGIPPHDYLGFLVPVAMVDELLEPTNEFIKCECKHCGDESCEHKKL